MNNWNPKPLRPKAKDDLFPMEENVTITKGALEPLQAQRRLDGTPLTRHARTALYPKGPELYLGEEHVSKGSLNAKDENDSPPKLDPDEVVKAFLSIND